MRVLLAIALTACSARVPAGPAWPRSAASDVDGGESLSPRPPAHAVAAAVADDDQEDHAVAEPRAAATPAAAPTGGDPPAAAPAPPAADGPEDLEEIVIEVDD